MSSWAANLGKKAYQITYQVSVGYTILADNEEEATEMAERVRHNEREYFFIEIDGNGVDWISAEATKVGLKDE